MLNVYNTFDKNGRDDKMEEDFVLRKRISEICSIKAKCRILCKNINLSPHPTVYTGYILEYDNTHVLFLDKFNQKIPIPIEEITTVIELQEEEK